MTDAPDQHAEGPLKLVVTSAGSLRNDEVIAVTIDKAINRVPSAQIVIRDGDMQSGTFPASDGDAYKPGAAITLAAGYGNEAETVFEGIVVGQGFSIDADSLGTLTVECRDKAVAMTVGRNSANYVHKKDSDVAQALIAKAGLRGAVNVTKTTWKELVQFHCTDWDFMLSRAEAVGFVVIVDAGTVSFAAPDVSSAPVLEVTFGRNLLDFQCGLDARDQFASVCATAWDIATLDAVSAKAGGAALNAQGNISSADLAAVLGIATLKLQTPVPLDAEALKRWADAQQLKSGLSRLRGSLSFQGSTKARVGAQIRLAGVGKRFAGNLYISAVRHELRDGNLDDPGRVRPQPRLVRRKPRPAAARRLGATAGHRWPAPRHRQEAGRRSGGAVQGPGLDPGDAGPERRCLGAGDAVPRHRRAGRLLHPRGR